METSQKIQNEILKKKKKWKKITNFTSKDKICDFVIL